MSPDWDSLPIFPLVSKIRNNQLLGKGEVQTLARWFSKCAPKLASALLPGNVSEAQILRTHPGLPGSETRAGAQPAVLIRLLGDSHARMSFRRAALALNEQPHALTQLFRISH